MAIAKTQYGSLNYCRLLCLDLGENPFKTARKVMNRIRVQQEVWQEMADYYG